VAVFRAAAHGTPCRALGARCKASAARWDGPERCAQLRDACCQKKGESHKSHTGSGGARPGAARPQSCLQQAQGTGQNRLGKPPSPPAAVQSHTGHILPAVTSRRGLWVAFIASATDPGPCPLDRTVLALHLEHLREWAAAPTPSAPQAVGARTRAARTPPHEHRSTGKRTSTRTNRAASANNCLLS